MYKFETMVLDAEGYLDKNDEIYATSDTKSLKTKLTLLKKIERNSYFFIKRIFDIFCSLIGLIAIIPVAVITKICYLVTGDKKSIFYQQKFINVLKGDMSLIGPRPLVIGELDSHNGNHQVYESVQPGVRGCWAVSLFANNFIKEVA